MSTRTSRPDRNWLSFSGDTLMWYLGTDHPEPCARVPVEARPPNPLEWDSAVKVSGNTYPIHTTIAIAQCRENALDINHSADVTVRGVFGHPGEVGEQVITVKGGSHHITLAGAVESRGTNASIVLGQWSDQSTERSHHLDLGGLYSTTDEPLTVIMVRVDHKTVTLPAGAKVLRVKSLLWSAYWWAKLAAVKVGLFGGGK